MCGDFPGGSDSKESACNARDPGLIPGWGRSPGVGYDNPLQYSCLEKPMHRGSCQATVYGVTKSRTRLSNFTLTFPRSRHIGNHPVLLQGFPGGSVVKNPPASGGDAGLIPGWGRSPGEGNGHPLQYSCLGNPRDRGAWRATVQKVTKSWT